MDWRRIGKYFVILWIVTSLVGFFFGFVEGAISAAADFSVQQKQAIGDRFLILQGVSMLSALGVATTRFAYRLKGSTLVSTILLFFLLSASSFPVNVLWFKQSISEWAIGGLLSLVAGLAGCSIAVLLRKRAAKLAVSN